MPLDIVRYNLKYHILEFYSHCITDIPSVELLGVAPVCCGSKTTIKSVTSSIPTLEKVEWQKSKDGAVFYSIREEKDFEDTGSSFCPFFVIHNASFVDKLYYRLLVWNGIGVSVSSPVYLNVTGSMIGILGLSYLHITLIFYIYILSFF